MWEFRHKVRSLVSAVWAHPRTARRSAGGAADWLPPVLGPQDWSIGMMSDRSASWYFERDRA